MSCHKLVMAGISHGRASRYTLSLLNRFVPQMIELGIPHLQLVLQNPQIFLPQRRAVLEMRVFRLQGHILRRTNLENPLVESDVKCFDGNELLSPARRVLFLPARRLQVFIEFEFELWILSCWSSVSISTWR